MSAPLVSSQPYTLEELIQAGWNKSPQIRNARLNSKAARIQQASARSQFFPEISAQIGASWMSDPLPGLTIPGGSFAPGVPAGNVTLSPGGNDWNYQASIRLHQPIFTWGKIIEGLKLAQQEFAIANLELERTRREISRDITKAFDSLHFSHTVLEHSQLLASVLKEILQDRQKRFEAGAINKEEVLEAQLRVREIESQVIEAELTTLIALRQLSILTGIHSIQYHQVATQEQKKDMVLSDIQGFIDTSIPQNHEMLVLGIRLQQAMGLARIEARSRGPLPDLGLTVEFTLGGTEFPSVSNWQDSWNRNLTVTLGTQVNLFDGGRQLARIREQKLQAERLGQGINDRELALSIEILRVYETWVRAQRKLLNTQAKLDYILEQERNARVSFYNDLISREQVLGARVMLIKTQLELSAAEFELRRALADLAFFSPDQTQ